MKTNRANYALLLMVALALPLVAISAGLQSCSEDGPGIPSEDVIEETTQVKNLLMRSPEEAIDIAQRAWEDFYGEGASPASRSGRCVIDYGRPVEVVRSAKSRGGSGSDTLLYVVNFADDGGFAVIAAPRHADELLAVTSQGHYYPESQPDQERVPGFELWMENARAYAASGPVSMDTTKRYPPLVGLDTLGLGDKPVFPPGGPTIERDTTGKPDPIDPSNPGRLQQKEWNDTVINARTNPQIRNSWGQGSLNKNDLGSYPEGYKFGNGLCGCGPLAVAEICLFYKTPSSIKVQGMFEWEDFHLNWDIMQLHKCWTRYETDPLKYYDLCASEYKEDAHSMIAQLCYSIGLKARANVKSGSTGVTKGACLSALKYFLPSRKISNDWEKMWCENHPYKNQIMLVRGDKKGSNGGHIWVCDGSIHIEYYHYFATRPNSNCEWEIQSKESGRVDFNHFNWGWYGKCNGWYNQDVIDFPSDDGEYRAYCDFEYVLVK